jgi:hypothetical protein
MHYESAASSSSSGATPFYGDGEDDMKYGDTPHPHEDFGFIEQPTPSSSSRPVSPTIEPIRETPSTTSTVPHTPSFGPLPPPSRNASSASISASTFAALNHDQESTHITDLRTRQVRALVQAAWPHVSPDEVVHGWAQIASMGSEVSPRAFEECVWAHHVTDAYQFDFGFALTWIQNVQQIPNLRLHIIARNAALRTLFVELVSLIRGIHYGLSPTNRARWVALRMRFATQTDARDTIGDQAPPFYDTTGEIAQARSYEEITHAMAARVAGVPLAPHELQQLVDLSGVSHKQRSMHASVFAARLLGLRHMLTRPIFYTRRHGPIFTSAHKQHILACIATTRHWMKTYKTHGCACDKR